MGIKIFFGGMLLLIAVVGFSVLSFPFTIWGKLMLATCFIATFLGTALMVSSRWIKR